MASRTHYLDDGNTRITYSTIGTRIPFPITYIEWGGEMRREEKRRIPVDWWNPFTWSGFEWVRRNPPPNETVEFFRGDGSVIPYSVVWPAEVVSRGYRKINVVYTYANIGTGRPPTDLGNDARSVTNVVITYTINGSTARLSHNS